MNLKAAFEVRESPGKGQGLFAARPVRVGDVIIKECPLILAPKQTSPYRVCIGCMKIESELRSCEDCLAPVCQKCLKKPAFHAEECTLFRKSGNVLAFRNTEGAKKLYSFLAPLRLILRARHKGQHGLLDMTDNHYQMRKDTSVHAFNEVRNKQKSGFSLQSLQETVS